MHRKYTIIILLFLCSNLLAQTETEWSGSDVTIDTWLDASAAGTNYGDADTIFVGAVFGNYDVGLFKITTLMDSLPSNAVVTAFEIQVYVTFPGGASVVINSVKACKPWVEDEATRINWSSAFIWTLVSAQEKGTDCDNCDNTGDDTGDDQVGPLGETGSISSTGWVTVPIDTCHINDWIRGDDANNGIILQNYINLTSVKLFSSEAVSNKPIFKATWVVPDDDVPNAKQSIDGGGVKQSIDGASRKQGIE